MLRISSVLAMIAGSATAFQSRTITRKPLALLKAVSTRTPFIPQRPFASTTSSSTPSRFVRKTLHPSVTFSCSLFNATRGRPATLKQEGLFREFATSASATMGENVNENEVYSSIRSYDSHYINGKWVSPLKAGSTIEVVDSNTGKAVATIPAGTEEDTIKAIEAAKSALPGWSKDTTPRERWEYMNAFLERFVSDDRVNEIVDRLVVELGCTKAFARNVQHIAPHIHTKTILDLLDTTGDSTEGKFEWEHSAGSCTVVKEPIGVVAAITPWNYPLHQIALKVIPALLAGCTVVLKPSEVTPLCAYSFAEAMDEAGLPSGVFNMVMGRGPDCGEVLARHPDVSLVSFTGSTRAGKILTKVAADSGTMKAIRTELGGKSAAVILEDADFEKVVPGFVKQLTSNTGQSCNALSRMLVPRDRCDEVCEIVSKTMEKEIVGLSTDPNATIGPLVSETQYNAVRSYIERGISEGAKLVTGGPEAPEGTKDSGGYFVKPTLFADVTNDMTIAQEEIFGPVLCVIPYNTEDEAIKLANDTPYGLNNAVASGDLKRALKVASKLESGCVMVNKTSLDSLAPFGGYKQSGNAREWGLAGIEEYLITKTVNVPIEDYRAVVYGSETKSSD